jgi:circadian clock protein KaiC
MTSVRLPLLDFQIRCNWPQGKSIMTGNEIARRVPTGIDGFDEVARGGLPAGRSTLVCGTTGSGKTLFAVEFLARGIQQYDEPGVYVTFEEPPADIRRNVASLGFSIAQWESEGKWIFVDGSTDVTYEETLGKYTFEGLLARVQHAVERIGARRVSLDSIGAIFASYPNVGAIRHELHRFVSTLNGLGVTSVHTAERLEEYDGISRLGVEEFVFSHVIVLRHILREERRRRTIEVVKFRGASHRSGEWLFTIDERQGIVVIPLAFLTKREPASTQRVSSGNPNLDAMCAGGFFKDAIVLLTGPTGTGKTLTALTFADASYRAGERCLLYTFDETRNQLARNAAGWGFNLDTMEGSGLLQVTAEYPEVASLEAHFLNIRHAIDEMRPSRLIIDTISSLERIATPRALLDFVIALALLLRQHEITAMLTSGLTGRTPTSASPAVSLEVGSLADVTIMLRYVEGAGDIQRAIAVVQTRGSGHDQAIRQVLIDSQGMHIGEPLSEVRHEIPHGTFLPEGQQRRA